MDCATMDSPERGREVADKSLGGVDITSTLPGLFCVLGCFFAATVACCLLPAVLLIHASFLRFCFLRLSMRIFPLLISGRYYPVANHADNYIKIVCASEHCDQKISILGSTENSPGRVNQIDYESVNEVNTVTYQEIILQAWFDGPAQDPITIDQKKTEDQGCPQYCLKNYALLRYRVKHYVEIMQHSRHRRHLRLHYTRYSHALQLFTAMLSSSLQLIPVLSCFSRIFLCDMVLTRL